MNARLATTLSIAANVVLAAALWLGHARPSAVVPPPRPVRAAVAIPKPEPAPVPAPAAPSPASAATIRWSEIASTNFFAYRDNLRAIGCPEKTVRDILESEVADYFVQLRRPIIDSIQLRFWDAVAKGGKSVLEDADDAFDKLNTEQRELLASLLGDPPENVAELLANQREGWQRQYDWLPAAQQAALLQLEERHWREERDLQHQIAQRTNSTWTAEDHARRKEMADAFQRARKELLGEFAGEDALRHSQAAGWANGLTGFQPSEAEWRAVTQIQWDAEKSGGGGVDVKAQIASALGPDRYAEYDRARDGDYQQTLRVTRRLGLADATAGQAWEIQRAATVAAQQLRANTGLDDASRQAALSEVAREADRSLRAAWGETGFATYREYAGAWMKDLAGGK